MARMRVWLAAAFAAANALWRSGSIKELPDDVS